MRRLLVLILTFGLFAGAAHAHNGMQHVMGIVTAITETSVSVKTTNDTVQVIHLSSDTKYLKGENAITAKDIAVGDHIVVHAAKKDGALVAAEVKVGAIKGMHGDMSGMKMKDGKRAHP